MAAAKKTALLHSSSTTSMAGLEQVEQDCRRLIQLCQSSKPRSPPWIQARSQLGGAMEQREWILEQRRVATVKQEFQATTGKTTTPSLCSFCQQPLPPNSIASSWKTCCGSQLCTTCAPPTSTGDSAGCPICFFPKSDDSTIASIAVQAEDGIAWAQCRMAMYLASQNDHEMSASYMERAAQQNHVLALYSLGCAQATGVNVFVDETAEGAYESLRKAAQLGYPHAQYRVGILCLDDEDDNNKERYNENEAIRWLTLAAAQNQIDAQTILASLYMNARGKSPPKGQQVRDATSLLYKPNLERAKYWAAVGANQEYGPSQFLLAQTMLVLGRQTYMGNLYIPGYSPIPTIAYWLRRALQNGCQPASQMLTQILQRASIECAGCGKTATATTGGLSRCGNCQCVYYCDRDCSLRHWTSGHKKDCVKLPPPPTTTMTTTTGRTNNDNNDTGNRHGENDDDDDDDGRTLPTASTSFSSSLGGAGSADTSWLDLLN